MVVLRIWAKEVVSKSAMRKSWLAMICVFGGVFDGFNVGVICA